MATLSEQEYQDLIVAEVGDDASGVLALNVPLYWARRDGITDLEARFLSVKRDAILLMLGRVRARVNVQGLGFSRSDDQLTTHLQDMLATVDAAIALGGSVANAGGATGELTTTAPIVPPDGSFVDANDRAYRGDAYRRRARR